MHADDREDVADFAFQVVTAMRGQRGSWIPDPGFLQVLSAVGIDPMDFRQGLREARTEGIRVQAPPDQVHAYRDLMMPALVRVGAVTERSRARYAEAGITIYEDETVLRSMEEAL
jgi:hypothetical protein